MYEIYVDILICANIFINYFILLAISRIFSIEFKRYRLILAATLGGFFSLLIFLPNNFFVVSLILKFLTSLIVILVAFRINCFFNFIKISSSFYIINFLFAGILLFFWYFLDTNDIFIKNSTVYFNISPIFFMVTTLISYFIIRVLSFFTENRNSNDEFCKLKIEQNNKVFNLKAKIDTGNNLKDPFSNRPVAVVEYKFIEEIIPENVKKYFFGSSINTKEKSSQKLTSLKFRAIPFNTILGSGIMPAFKPEKIKLVKSKEIEIEKDAFIAVCKGKLLGENFSALVGPDFFD